MKLSTRSTYGVRAALTLAIEYGRGPIMVKEIAEKQSLPITYLEQLMTLLRKAGLVNATRGAHGGYVLSRSPAEITVADVVEVLEGPLTLAECPSGAGCCGKPEACALNDLWANATQALVRVFEDVTLAKLVEKQREKESGAVLSYSI